jgi:hypothetical protein
MIDDITRLGYSGSADRSKIYMFRTYYGKASLYKNKKGDTFDASYITTKQMVFKNALAKRWRQRAYINRR